MKKASEEDLLAERPNLDFSKGIRGKYYNRLAEGTNIAILDPALMDQFPDSESVNLALHAFLSMPEQDRKAALQRSTSELKFTKPAFDPRMGTLEKAS